jgi:three-Cys-motif partner protein
MLRRLVAGALVASARTGIRPSSERPSGGGGRPASLASYIRMSPEPVLWPREEHTKAKHELLLAFFNKWVSIHSSYFASRPAGGLVRIYDGFAGPGVYAGGEPGSPLIIMRALCSNANLFTRWSRVRYDIHFVEKNPARAEALEKKITEFQTAMHERGPRWTDRVSWTVTCGLYEENVPKPVAEPSALFLFLDPFGYSHAPMTLTQTLVQQPKSDTLIFLPLSFVNRFRDREGQEVALDRFFGTPTWREIPDGAPRPACLLALFEAQLRKAGLDYVGAFSLRPDSTNKYFIVGGSGHPKGWASIKEGFWAVDPINGAGYQAPKSPPPGQQTFGFDEPGPPRANTRPLLAALRAEFGDRWFTVEDAMRLTERSRFLDTHLKRATLAPAEARGELEVIRPPGARQFRECKGIRMRFADRPAC